LKIVALLTGRGGSNLKDKNILEVCGRPLLVYPSGAAKQSSKIHDFYVSSDDEKIISVAHQLGFKKIKRPENLAKPDAKHVDVLLHALEAMENQGVVPDILVVVLANSVCVKTEWIDQCIDEIQKDPSISAVVPVVEDLDHHPFRAKRRREDGLLESFFDFEGREISSNRQELGGCFFLCHNFWVLNVKSSVFSGKGQPPWGFMGGRVKPFEVEWSIDVHTEEDLVRSEHWVKQNL
jgi:CMP-N,N'-diacetyllegionaminic acid synthase